jgi:hypothetical protein
MNTSKRRDWLYTPRSLLDWAIVRKLTRWLVVGGLLIAAPFLLPFLVAGCGTRSELLGVVGVAGDAAAPDTSGGPTHRFSDPQLVTALSDPMAQDGDPTFTGDLLELFFMSDRSGSRDIWTSKRATARDPWGPPVIVPELNSFFGDYGPAVSLDGLRIWFTTDRDMSPGRIWRSSRPARSDVWAAPQPVPEIASSAKDFSPTVDATETTMMFGSNRFGAGPGPAGFDIYGAIRPNANAPWGMPRPVLGVNGPFDDWDPFVAQGGLVIFFTSLREGGGDIFWSERQSTTAPFPRPVALVDVNSASYDSDSNLSPDLTYMMFDSTRSGNSEIYETHAIP